jgi:hypothetical protein
VGVTSNPDVLSVYAPGKEADRWPDGVAKRIPAGSNIILQMHYSKLSGKPEKDRTSVALVFASKPVGNMVGTRSVSNDLFLIPPGAENHEVRACWTFQRDLELISFMPHMHVRGKSMKYELVYPDGRLETALSVPNYSFHWQTQYTLQHPLPVPAGTRLIVTAHYDNSDRNMHNPDPTRAVRHGTATFDEMMIGFVNYVIPKPHDHIVVRLDPRVFDKYVGKYEMEPGVVLEIIKVGDKLFADAGGQKIQLLPASETVFFSKATDSELTFLKNGQGETIEFTVTLNDKRSRFKKIN